MNKWVKTVATVTVTVAAALIVRQILQDMSDRAELWQSVTDTIEE